MRLNHVLCAGLALAPGLTEISAQAAASPVAPRRLGIAVGMNSSTVGGGDVGNPSRRAGLIAGVSMVAPVSANVAIEPQVLFTSKGANFHDSGGGGSITMNYLQVPVLVRFDFAGSGGVRPFVFGGPAIALKASCDLEGLQGGVSTSISCDDLEADGVRFKSVDYGVIVGGGVAFNVGGRTLSIGARYDHSLADIDDQSGIRHRVISFMATFEFPWRK